MIPNIQHPRIYLDYNATAPVRPEVMEEVLPILADQEGLGFGNASSIHWAGRSARRYLENARTRMARLFGCKASEVTFTSGATEANNLALIGVMSHQKTKARRLIVSAVEHPATLSAADRLEAMGIEVVRTPVPASGALDLDAIERALATPTALMSIMAVNNETGIVHELRPAIDLARSKGTLVHVDAVQAVGKLPLPTEADLISVSGHKLGGLKGTGALIRREHAACLPQVVGGPQERGHRAGTENVAGAIALARAIESAERERERENVRLEALRDRFEEGVRRIRPDVLVLGSSTTRVSTTSTLVFDGVEGDLLLQALDLEGVAASSGSACSSGSLEPSHVLLAMGLGRQRAMSGLRFSLGWKTRPEEIERALEVLPVVLAQTARS